MASYQHIDTDNMHQSIYEFSDHIMQAIEIGESISIKNQYNDIHNVVVAGMGGSAIGGDVARLLCKNELKVPMVVSRNYTLPGWVNNNTLVICSSYSGNTEEPLSALDDALNKKAQVCGFTTGGELGKHLKKLGKDLVIIPSGLQPRAALAFSFVPMVKLLEKNCDWIIANDVSNKAIGFDSSFNEVSIFYKNMKYEKLPKMKKSLLADNIVKKVISHLN